MVKFPVLCNKNINIIYVHVYQKIKAEVPAPS